MPKLLVAPLMRSAASAFEPASRITRSPAGHADHGRLDRERAVVERRRSERDLRGVVEDVVAEAVLGRVGGLEGGERRRADAERARVDAPALELDLRWS